MVVIDASVAWKWLVLDEVLTEQAVRLLERFLKEEEKIIAPDIILYELGNALASKTQLSPSRIKMMWQKLVAYQITIISSDWDFIKRAIEFSKKHRTSVYDASYAVLAKQEGCSLITADDKFARQVNLSFVESLANYS